MISVALILAARCVNAEGCSPRYVDGEVRSCACSFADRDYVECRAGVLERCQEIVDCRGPSKANQRLVETAALGDVEAINHAFSILGYAARRQAGEQALCVAVEIGHAAAVDALLDLGISPNARSAAGVPALLYPNGYRLPMLRLPLDRGADPNVTLGTDITALISAVHQGRSAEAQLLLERGADPNASTSITRATALIYAASNGDLQRVRNLLNRGARPHHRAQYGRTAADVARDRGHHEIATILEQSH